MSSVRRKLFKEGSNSWASETIVERQNNEAFENGRTEIIEYTVVNEGDAAVKEQFVENPHGLKTPQENAFRPVAPSFSEKVSQVVYILFFLYSRNVQFTKNQYLLIESSYRKIPR